MKKSILLIYLIFCFFQLNGQELSVMTYNIRLDVASDGENAWPNRKEMMISQFDFYEPDIFGIQEGMPHQVEYIDNKLRNYNFIGQGRDGGSNGEYSALYYKSSKFSIKDSGTFWLSETPDKVSKGWDAAYPRICTYTLFKDRESKLVFWVFNTHLDHLGEKARIEGVKLILAKIKEFNQKKYPVILMGDFNLEPDNEVIVKLKKRMNDSRGISLEAPFGPEGTFNRFNYFEEKNNRIDYIFVSKSIKVQKYAVLNNSNNLKFASDHFPVFVELLLE